MSSQSTPLMAQYYKIKAAYPDALLFFQVGDFYELFFEDAVKAAHFLAITLTKRGKANGQDIPLCGVPVHALQFYLVKLIKGGFSVALCDQIGKPQPGTVVERAVTKVYTPGTLTDETMLASARPSYLGAVMHAGQCWEVVFLELLTMQCVGFSLPAGQERELEAELARFAPDEVVVPAGDGGIQAFLKKWGYVVTTQALEALSAFELLYAYLERVQPAACAQLQKPTAYKPTEYVALDAATLKNIAVVQGSDGSVQHSVCGAVDGTVTAMGSRLLKKWIVRPLRDQQAIEQRLEVVDAFAGKAAALAQLKDVLASIADVERIAGRIALVRATKADYLALKQALRVAAALKTLLENSTCHVPLIVQVCRALEVRPELQELLDRSMYEGSEEWLIKEGYDSELDAMRSLFKDGHLFIEKYAAEQVAATGIGSLKILYTSVAGYFIEVTKTHAEKVPDHYRHIQTLAGRDRFVTADLSALQRQLHEAEGQMAAREKEVYGRVEYEISRYGGDLARMARALATLDVLVGFARVAAAQRYVRPTFTTEKKIHIRQGRHPVVEQALGSMAFVANDTTLDENARFWLVTGPNMGGKSTYLRQVALISLLAQCGSFVPAGSAELMLVDRIFTRIGAGDNVAQGKSTFLIEMEETATICLQATGASLVILDEVGRGTSTEDGRALAWAISEYLAGQVQSFTLFATHYHELTSLAGQQEGLVNYQVRCVKKGEDLHFMHKVEPGVSASSFGIEVAKMAQLPPVIIARARQLLTAFGQVSTTSQPVEAAHVVEPDPLREMLAEIDVDDLSPRAAFELVCRLKKIV